MAPRQIIYDITRLVTRFSRAVPNGIDRVDSGFAKHFLTRARGGVGAIVYPSGGRLVLTEPASRICAAIEEHWRENQAQPDVEDRELDWIGAQLREEVPQKEKWKKAWSSSRKSFDFGRTRDLLKHHFRDTAVLGRSGLIGGQNLARHAERNALYVNASQFPIWCDSCFRWLDQRPDLQCLFFIHDVLPVRYPEFFPPSECARHAKRLEVVSRRAAALIVSSDVTAQDLQKHFRDCSLRSPPIHALPLPVAAEFNRTPAPGADLTASRPYFVTVGTIEPRKNHLLLLNIWRELVREGGVVPKLVIVGTRGWDN